MTSEAEKLDLEKLKADQLIEQQQFSDLCREFLRMDEQSIRHCGHKTQEAAIFSNAKRHIAELDKLSRAFIKKWPDT